MECLRRFLRVGMSILCMTAIGSAATWNEPATELTKRIAAITGRASVSLTVVNRSSLPQEQVPDIQKAIAQRLRAMGVVVDGTAEAQVNVTLSENLQGYLWVAEIKRGTDTQVLMLPVARESAPQVLQPGPSVNIQRALLWTQQAPMLDAVLLNPSKLLVLSPDAATMYSFENGNWREMQSWQVMHNHPFPRDVRGLIVLASDHLADLYLPGTVCSIGTGSEVSLSCHDGDDPWPIGRRSAFFNSARNYFTGATVPASDKSLPPFYSMASMENGGRELQVVAGIDGNVRIVDGASEHMVPTNISRDWGSDLVALKSKCGTGNQLLTTSAGDDRESDSLRAWEIADGNPIGVSAAAEVQGPIMALWQHGDNATAIVRSLKTGFYDAYSVSIACVQ